MSCPSSKWCQDSNSRPLKHELSPINTRPGLPPSLVKCYSCCCLINVSVQTRWTQDLHAVGWGEGL